MLMVKDLCPTLKRGINIPPNNEKNEHEIP